MKRPPRRKRRKRLWVAGILLAAAIGWHGLRRGAVEPPPYPAALTLVDRTGQPLRVVLGPNETLCEPVALEDTGPWAWKALVAVEDKRFFTHPGVDPLAILRATAQNLASRRVVSGASTLTTQVIRMTEPRPRTYATKVIEAVGALRLESATSKEEILTQYLNRAPLGGNLYGIQAASRAYFHKDAADLSLAEAALLMGLPQSPSRYRPDRHPARAAARQQKVLERMEACGFITAAQREAALRLAPATRRAALPFRAPHFCDLVLAQRRDGADFAPSIRGGRLWTTLDPAMQAVAESTIDQHHDALHARGIDGAAAVILDVASGDVLAMVGSPDFFGDNPAAQVNAAVARRSPGSTLKPLLYAAAIDRGFCIPDSILSDRPLAYPGYEPANMDLAFRGDVTLRDALQQSLNIPALRVAEAFGAEALLQGMRAFGFSTLDRTPEDYGLGLALGAAEVTLLDLTNAYAALARGGAWIPYRLARQQPESVGRRALVSPAAAYLVNCMLEAPSRLIDLRGYGEGADGPRLAWKTGTSSGGRDAWTIAYNPDVAVGVWVGTLSGPAPQGAVGIRDAAPMAFQILRRLYPDKKGPWFAHPPDVVDRDLCPISGQYAGPHCPIHIRGPVITDISLPGLCSAHQSATRAPTHTRPAVHITSPPDGSTYRRTHALPADRQQLPLTADAPEASTLHWFVNGTHLATQRDGQPLSWPLQPGTHTIACADESGHTHQIQILVH